MDSTKPPARVLYCESNTDGTIGGSHYCLFYLAEGLDRSRFEPIAVFYQDNALVPRFRSAGLDTRILELPKPFRPSVLDSGVAKFAPLGGLLRGGTKAINFVGFLKLILKYRRFLRDESIAIVHLNNSILRHHEWMWAARLSGIPCLTHERGINRRYPWLARYLGRRLQAVISMSKAIRELMVARGVSGDNIRVMYDGLDPARLEVRRPAAEIRQQFEIDTDRPVIGMVGNIRRWKGQEVLVRALSAVRDKYPRVVCLIVGDTAKVDKPYEEHVRGLVGELGLTDNVRFTGYQSNVQDFLNVMDVVVHASIEPEPFGMVVLEAMARRKPIVGSREGGVPEMIVEGDTGYTFPPGDSDELARRLIELLGEPDRARQMGERGYLRLVQHFSVHSYIRDIEGLYERILQSRDAPSTVPLAALGK